MITWGKTNWGKGTGLESKSYVYKIESKSNGWWDMAKGWLGGNKPTNSKIPNQHNPFQLHHRHPRSCYSAVQSRAAPRQ